MLSILLLGFLIGMQHALEVDHVAAVASLATRARSVRSAATHGAIWGLGHTVTLLLIGGGVVLLGTAVPPWLATALELAVGVMLILLGADVLRRLIRQRVHFHLHRHGDGKVHWHAHSHAGEAGPHDARRHDHNHAKRLPLRTLLVGMMHGMAGSAALLILALASVQSPSQALLYIVVFGFGSVVGMAALSLMIALPLTRMGRWLTWGHNGLQAAIGSVTMMIGAWILYDRGLVGWVGI